MAGRAAYMRAYRKANPEKVREYQRRHHAKYPEANKAYKNLWRIENPEGQRQQEDRYKIKKESKLAEIAGRSRPAICELCSDGGRIVFDHCHISGKFRGWICDRCNKVLGLVKDSKDVLLSMISYLEGQNG